MARYLALIGCIHTTQQAKQGGFARTVDPQNTDVAILRQCDAHIAQHIVAAELGGVVLGYIVENDHVIPHSLAISWRSAGDQPAMAQTIAAHGKGQQQQGHA